MTGFHPTMNEPPIDALLASQVHDFPGEFRFKVIGSDGKEFQDRVTEAVKDEIGSADRTWSSRSRETAGGSDTSPSPSR